MNQPSQHNQVDELLPAAALEILEGQELAQVLDHTRACGECGRLLDEYREVAAAVALVLPPEPLEAERSVRLRERLLARARRDPPASATGRTSVASARPRGGGIDRWAGWAVAAGLVGVLLTHHGFHRPLAYGWVVAGVAVIALAALGVYAMVQRARITALEERLAQLERDRAG
jgi:hypothetical protein